MLIERNAFDAATLLPQAPKGPACLDCPDCQGTCWTAAELRRLPETVLHARDDRG